jgi:hypothetical protein
MTFWSADKIFKKKNETSKKEENAQLFDGVDVLKLRSVKLFEAPRSLFSLLSSICLLALDLETTSETRLVIQLYRGF